MSDVRAFLCLLRSHPQLREAAAKEMDKGDQGQSPVLPNRFIRYLRGIAAERKTCDTDHGGCGQFQDATVRLRRPPECFTVVLGWESDRVAAEDIRATVAALDVAVDISGLYKPLGASGARYHLRCVVCYYGQHYHAFVRVDGGGGGGDSGADSAASGGQWLMFDDTTIKPVGRWEAVLAKCFEGHLQPSVLFYDRERQTQQ